MSFNSLVQSGTIMDNSDATDMMEPWRSDGGFFRHMLRNVA
jgi:hypothetical protein